MHVMVYIYRRAEPRDVDHDLNSLDDEKQHAIGRSKLKRKSERERERERERLVKAAQLAIAFHIERVPYRISAKQ